MSHIPNQIHQTWNSALLPEQGGTLHAAFHVATDGMLLEARNAERVALAVTVSRGSLVVEAPEDHIVLDVEDTYGVQFGGVHDLHITFGDFGTRIYLDGYQAFACATNICPSKYVKRISALSGWNASRRLGLRSVFRAAFPCRSRILSLPRPIWRTRM